MSAGHSTKIVLTSLAANGSIAIAKGVAAVLTRSGSMLAEAIHTAADCFNQVLLLVGMKQATEGASEKYPLGTGRASYFWSFIVAQMLFFGGGVFSIGEGVEHILHPQPLSHLPIALGILIFSLVLEALSFGACVKQINEKRGALSATEYLRTTKDAELVVCTGENFAAVVGLAFALVALLLAKFVDPRFDGVGSVMVGLVLVWVAYFLARKVRSLLLGEAASPEIEAGVKDAAKGDERIEEVLRIIAVQQGPGEVMIAVKLRLRETITAKEVVDAINAFEARVRERLPDVKWQFIEPDTQA